MRARYGREARQAIKHGKAVAELMNHRAIGSEHLVAGIAAGDGPGASLL